MGNGDKKKAVEKIMEDCKEEGLRKAKMFYRPAFMLEKGFLRMKSDTIK